MKIKVYDIEFTWEEDGLDYNCLNLPDEIEFNTDYIVNLFKFRINAKPRLTQRSF